jgi:hypothetical protein
MDGSRLASITHSDRSRVRYKGQTQPYWRVLESACGEVYESNPHEKERQISNDLRCQTICLEEHNEHND